MSHSSPTISTLGGNVSNVHNILYLKVKLYMKLHDQFETPVEFGLNTTDT